jgi:hypothetical protein
MALWKRYGLIFGAWLFAGLTVLFTHYMQTSRYSKDALDEQITLVAASHFGLSQLVDNLPSVFKENGHASALKISDLRGAFLGAMYDSRRMPAQMYKAFLESRSFDLDKSPFPGYVLHSWESKRRKLRILALSLERMQFSEYLGRMSRDISLHYLIPLYILLGLGLIAGYHYFTEGFRTSLRLPSITTLTGKRKAAQSTGQVFSTRQGGESNSGRSSELHSQNAWQLRPGIIAESHIRETLSHLKAISGAVSVSFCARRDASKKEPWSGVLELRGSIFVRGGAMHLPPSDEQRDADNLWYQPSPDQSEWYFFGGSETEVVSCFILRFAQPEASPNSDALDKISGYVRKSTRPLLVEHYYESSIIDSESGLYSSPYAMFTLKEKLLSGMPLATAALRFAEPDTNRGQLQKTSRTAIRVMREFFAAENAPTIARGAEDTLLIIFAAEKTPSGTALKSMTQLISSYKNLGRRIHVGFIEDTALCGNPQQVLKTLSQLMDKSMKSGQIELYATGKPARIL